MDPYQPLRGVAVEVEHYNRRRQQETRVRFVVRALTAFFSFTTFLCFLLVRVHNVLDALSHVTVMHRSD
jgi:hypothetical protein